MRLVVQSASILFSIRITVMARRTGAQLRGALSAEEIEIPTQVREALDEISTSRI